VIRIDLEAGTVTVSGKDGERSHALASPEAFAVISDAWLRCGWDTKYVYGFTWLGRPVIQLPEDLVRVQELVYQVKPDVIIETGVAHGGGQVFFASLCKAMGKGRVIGIDIEIRPHNRTALEAHELYPLITLIEGSSVDPGVVGRLKGAIKPGERVLVVLDSNHTKDHVLKELEAYGPLVGVGSYIVAADGIMQQMAGAPRSSSDWSWNNPISAIREFLSRHPEFKAAPPPQPFNEGLISRPVTYWPEGYLRRIA
jgi:cephalosporin hydroxylase